MSTRRILTLLALAFPGCHSDPSAQGSTRFDADRAWTHLEAQVALGPRHPGSEASRRCREAIVDHLRGCGLEPQREAFTVEDTPRGRVSFENVYADLEPPDRPGRLPLVILGSHFDTKVLGPSFVGANDGGSSTAVLLELARVLSADRPVGLALRFLFLDGEEALGRDWIDPDNRYGSRYHAAKLRQDDGQFPRVKAFVLLDMVGDVDLRLTTDRYSTGSLLELFFATARESGLGRYVDGPRREVLDDHLSFRQYGVDAVDLIDLEFGPNNDWWHTEKDTLENCSPKSLEVAGRLVLLALPRLARRYAPPDGD